MIKTLLRSISSLLLVAAVLFSFAVAQSGGNSKPTGPLPFDVGESLTYEGKISRFITVTVGDMTFNVVNAPGSENMMFKVEARSKGTLLKLFRFSFFQQIDSTADRHDFKVLTTTKHDVQKERVRDSVARFDYQNRKVTYIETDPKSPMKPPRTIASDLTEPTQDIISGIYRLRMLPLAVGYSDVISVSDSGLVYKIPVRVTKREQQKTIFGKIWTLRIEPEVFGTNRFIEQKGSMVIWVTDDARHIPVRSQVRAAVGKIDIRLKDAKNLK